MTVPRSLFAFALALVLVAIDGAPVRAQTAAYIATYGAWEVRGTSGGGTDTTCFARSIDAAAQERDVFWLLNGAVVDRFPQGQLIADPRLLPVGGMAEAVIDGEQRFDLVQSVDGYIRSQPETSPALFDAMRAGLEMAIVARGSDEATRRIDLSLIGFTSATDRALRACQAR